jgi:hypothetical protein
MSAFDRGEKMKVKIIAAIATLTIVSVILGAAAASAFMAQPISGSTGSNSISWWPFGDDHQVEGFREGGMMQFGGPDGQNNNAYPQYSGEDWGWHG